MLPPSSLATTLSLTPKSDASKPGNPKKQKAAAGPTSDSASAGPNAAKKSVRATPPPPEAGSTKGVAEPHTGVAYLLCNSLALGL